MFELAAANREIEALRQRLEELEMTHLARINPGLPNYNNIVNSNNNNIVQNNSNNSHNNNKQLMGSDANKEKNKNNEKKNDDDDDVEINDNIRKSVASLPLSPRLRHPHNNNQDVIDEAAGPGSPHSKPSLDKLAPAAASPLRGCKCRSCLQVHAANTTASVAARAVPPR